MATISPFRLGSHHREPRATRPASHPLTLLRQSKRHLTHTQRVLHTQQKGNHMSTQTAPQIVRVNITAPSDLIAAAKVQARSEDRSFSSALRVALRGYVSNDFVSPTAVAQLKER